MPYAEITLRLASKRSGRIGSRAQYASTPINIKTNAMQEDNANRVGGLYEKLSELFWIWSRNTKRDIFARARLTEPRKSILLNFDQPLSIEASTVLNDGGDGRDSLRQM